MLLNIQLCIRINPTGFTGLESGSMYFNGIALMLQQVFSPF